MGGLSTKKGRLKVRANTRKAVLKQLNFKPVIKRVDVEAIKKEWEGSKNKASAKKEEEVKATAPQAEVAAKPEAKVEKVPAAKKEEGPAKAEKKAEAKPKKEAKPKAVKKEAKPKAEKKEKDGSEAKS